MTRDEIQAEIDDLESEIESNEGRIETLKVRLTLSKTISPASRARTKSCEPGSTNFFQKSRRTKNEKLSRKL